MGNDKNHILGDLSFKVNDPALKGSLFGQSYLLFSGENVFIPQPLKAAWVLFLPIASVSNNNLIWAFSHHLQGVES